jgi:hypothetical protein
MMKPSLVWLTVVLVAPDALAAANDFARGAAIELPAQPNAAYRFAVPADVYRWSTRDDLGDLRVLDGNGNEVPYTLRVPPGGDALTVWTDLPAFAMPAAATKPGSAAVNIELGTGGAVVAVHGAAPSSEAVSYLVDAAAYDAPIDELQVTWDTSGDVFVATSIDASDDLNAWRTVSQSTTLAVLTTDGRSVKLDRIALASVRAKYLKLGFARSLSVTGVRVRSREATAVARAGLTLDGQPNDDGVEFDTGGRFPVDRVAVELAAPTYLIEARLYSRPRDDGPWRDLGTRTFYRATAGATAVQSDPMAVSGQPHRHWRVTVTPKTPDSPRLRIEWLPPEIVFIAQGAAPYRLAYGQAGAVAREWPVADLLKRLDRPVDLDTLPAATALQAEMAGGPERLIPPPAPIDWRTVWLWAVLVIGVGVVAGLAFRLLRQAKS